MTVKTIHRRILPPGFLREAEARKVDVGEHPPADAPDPGVEYLGVWVSQTGDQHADALALCTLLQVKYAPGSEERRWLDRTRKALENPPREVVQLDAGAS